MGRVILGNDRILAPGRWRWLRTLGWVAVLAVLVGLALNVCGRGAERAFILMSGQEFATRADIPQTYKLAGLVVGVIAAFAAYWAAVRWGENRRVGELALRPLPLDYAIGGAVGAGQMAVIIGVLAAAGWVIVRPSDVTAITWALKETLQSSMIEELLFRLIIFRLLWRAFGVWPGLIASAALFGGGHLANPNATLLGALSIVIGCGVEAGLYMLTGRIWASVGSHAGWNFAQGWIFGATVSGMADIAGGPLVTAPAPGVADALSGGPFGPEASLAALLISGTASVAVLWVAWKRGGFVEADAPAQASVNSATSS